MNAAAPPATAAGEPGSVILDGCRIQYEFRRDASAVRTLVFIHGWMDSMRDSDACLPHLASAGSTLRFDLAGHGLSGPAATYSVAEHAERVRGLLAALEIHRPVLIGHSMGAAVVVAMIDRDPEAYERAILVDPLLRRLPAPVRWLGRGLLAMSGRRLSSAVLRRLWNSGRWLDWWANAVDGPDSEQTRAARAVTAYGARAAATRVIHDGYRELLRDGMIAPEPGPGRQVYVIYGSRDPMMDRRRLGRLAPAERVVEVPEARHTPNRTHPDEFSRAVLDILATA